MVCFLSSIAAINIALGCISNRLKCEQVILQSYSLELLLNMVMYATDKIQ